MDLPKMKAGALICGCDRMHTKEMSNYQSNCSHSKDLGISEMKLSLQVHTNGAAPSQISRGRFACFPRALCRRSLDSFQVLLGEADGGVFIGKINECRLKAETKQACSKQLLQLLHTNSDLSGFVSEWMHFARPEYRSLAFNLISGVGLPLDVLRKSSCSSVFSEPLSTLSHGQS